MRTYLKVGYYRDASMPGTATVYLDGMVAGRMREDVVPPAPASSPAPPSSTDAGVAAPAPGLPVAPVRPATAGSDATAGPKPASPAPLPRGRAAAQAGLVPLAWALRRRRRVTGR